MIRAIDARVGGGTEASVPTSSRTAPSSTSKARIVIWVLVPAQSAVGFLGVYALVAPLCTLPREEMLANRHTHLHVQKRMRYSFPYDTTIGYPEIAGATLISVSYIRHYQQHWHDGPPEMTPQQADNALAKGTSTYMQVVLLPPSGSTGLHAILRLRQK